MREDLATFQGQGRGRAPPPPPPRAPGLAPGAGAGLSGIPFSFLMATMDAHGHVDDQASHVARHARSVTETVITLRDVRGVRLQTWYFPSPRAARVFLCRVGTDVLARCEVKHGLHRVDVAPCEQCKAISALLEEARQRKEGK